MLLYVSLVHASWYAYARVYLVSKTRYRIAFLFNFTRYYQTVSLNSCINNLHSYQEVIRIIICQYLLLTYFKIFVMPMEEISVVLICISLITNRVEYFSGVCGPFIFSLLWNMFVTFAIFPLGCFSLHS